MNYLSSTTQIVIMDTIIKVIIPLTILFFGLIFSWMFWEGYTAPTIDENEKDNESTKHNKNSSDI